jgi:hypothetical protein
MTAHAPPAHLAVFMFHADRLLYVYPRVKPDEKA